jgi:23S rRNA (pseudouridine1915-N3)-methyltransferase
VTWKIVAVGKPKLAFAADGIAEYLKRLGPMLRVEMCFLKKGDDAALIANSAGCFRIVMDERGAQLSSRELADKLAAWEMRSVSKIALIVGGADGLGDEARKSADFLWSLSRLTLQHELALMLALEQIYRACSIKAGMPYHRD